MRSKMTYFCAKNIWSITQRICCGPNNTCTFITLPMHSGISGNNKQFVQTNYIVHSLVLSKHTFSSLLFTITQWWRSLYSGASTFKWTEFGKLSTQASSGRNTVSVPFQLVSSGRNSIKVAQLYTSQWTEYASGGTNVKNVQNQAKAVTLQ